VAILTGAGNAFINSIDAEGFTGKVRVRLHDPTLRGKLLEHTGHDQSRGPCGSGPLTC
jgi:hypothetical protein